jgi:hypothetical protein
MQRSRASSLMSESVRPCKARYATELGVTMPPSRGAYGEFAKDQIRARPQGLG